MFSKFNFFNTFMILFFKFLILIYFSKFKILFETVLKILILKFLIFFIKKIQNFSPKPHHSNLNSNKPSLINPKYTIV